MIKYSIMCFIFGFTLNKLYFKNKSNSKSVKVASITAIVLIIIKLGILKLK